MPFYQDIEFEELVNKDDMNITGLGEMTAEAAFLCAFKDRIRLAAAFLGYPMGLNGEIDFMGAHQEPAFHNTSKLLKAMRVNIKGVGHNDGANQNVVRDQYGFLIYTHAIVKVSFGIPPYIVPGQLNEEPYIEESMDLSGQFVAVDRDHPYKWQNDGKRIDGSVIARKEMYFDTTYTIHRVRNFNKATFKPYMNRINSAVFRNTAVGCLLFEGVAARRTTTNLRVQPTEVVLKFRESERSWNLRFRPGASPEWQQTTPALFGTADFNLLVQALTQP